MASRKGIREAFLLWTFVGALVAAVLLVPQSNAVSGPSGLLRVGEVSALRPLIEAELGPVPLAPGAGHDGQISYAKPPKSTNAPKVWSIPRQINRNEGSQDSGSSPPGRTRARNPTKAAPLMSLVTHRAS